MGKILINLIMKTFALVALLGATSSFKLNHKFATGMNGDEDLN